MRSLSVKTSKRDRERRVLTGLVELYLKTGIPVGSNTLRNAGFHDLSSATIRNYFAKLEDGGFLRQQHSSGGRIPTDLAYREYAKGSFESTTISEKHEQILRPLRSVKTKEITGYLQKAAELLSELSQTAIFLSAPRFDHDFILDFRLISLDLHRCLCVVITDFGVIKTEVLHTEQNLNDFDLSSIEAYFRWRLTGQGEQPILKQSEKQLAHRFYNEVMVRYLVEYSNFSNEEIYRTGFSQLLRYPELSDATSLASGLALFENPNCMRLLLRECSKFNTLKYWIGDDLIAYTPSEANCAIIAIPYRINQHVVGAIGALGPTRIPYRELFGVLRVFADYISHALTQNIYKFKITFRTPKKDQQYLKQDEHNLIKVPILLEHKES